MKKKTYEDMEKDERIYSEIKKLKANYSGLKPKQKSLVEGLVMNAAFMRAQLYDLQEHINENGVIVEYQNGENQWGTKKSPEAELYNTMIKNYTSVISKLNDFLPKDKQVDDNVDGFDEFLNGKD